MSVLLWLIVLLEIELVSLKLAWVPLGYILLRSSPKNSGETREKRRQNKSNCIYLAKSGDLKTIIVAENM